MPTELLSNGSFSTGDYTGWTAGLSWADGGVVGGVAVSDGDTNNRTGSHYLRPNPTLITVYDVHKLYEIKTQTLEIPTTTSYREQFPGYSIKSGATPQVVFDPYTWLSDPPVGSYTYTKIYAPFAEHYHTCSGATEAGRWRIDNISARDMPGYERVWPTDVFQHTAWTDAANAADLNYTTYAWISGGKASPALSLGASASNRATNAWETRTAPSWTAAQMLVVFWYSGAVNDALTIRLTNAATSYSTVQTILPSTTANYNGWYAVYIDCNEVDWGTGFANYQNARIEVDLAVSQSNDNAHCRIYFANWIGQFDFDPEETLISPVSVTATLGIGYPKVYTASVTATVSESHRTDIPGAFNMSLSASPSLDPFGPMAAVHNAYASSSWSEIPWGDALKTPAFEILTSVVTATTTLVKSVAKQISGAATATASLSRILINNFLTLASNVISATAQNVETVKNTAVEAALTYAALAEVAYNEMLEQAQLFTQELTANITSSATVDTLFTKVLQAVITAAATVGFFFQKIAVATVGLWGRVSRSIADTVTVSVSTTASSVLRHYRSFLDTVGTVADIQKNMYKNLTLLVQTTASYLRDFTLSAKSVVVGVVTTLSPGKLLHRTYAAIVGTAGFALVRDIYQELHSAIVGVVGSVSKHRTLVVLANAAATATASVATFFFISRELVTNAVTATASLSKDVLKRFLAPVTAAASLGKNLYRRMLATVGTVARRFRKFTDRYLVVVGTAGTVVFRRLLSLTATVKARAIFARTVIKPVSAFVARVVFMVKRARPSAVVKDAIPTTLRDRGDTLVVQGLNMADLDITIQQGATFDVTLTWNDSAGNPINLTGYTARMQIRQTLESANFELEITTTPTSSGSIVLGGAAGTIQLIIPSTITAGFTWDEGVYDLEMISDAGPPEVVRRLLEGCVVVTPEVTR